ncbi:MAG: hypothetical protein IKK58_04535 [Clostridia bacterium]|nr:hypothetical protein [Clostridia bacterium]
MQYYDEPTARPVKKIIAIILAAVLALAALAGGGIFAYYEIRYNDAVALMRQCRYAEAIAAFEALNGYKDSRDLVLICKNPDIETEYQSAIELLEQGEDGRAYAIFKRLGNYKDSQIYLSCFRVFYDEVTVLSEGEADTTVYIKQMDGEMIRVYKNSIDFDSLIFEREYDAKGRLIALTDLNSLALSSARRPYYNEEYIYDDSSRLIKKITIDVRYTRSVTEYTYENGLLVKESITDYYDAENSSTAQREYSYDNEGRVIKNEYFRGAYSYSITYTYDRDLLVKVVYWRRNTDNKESTDVKSYRYDEMGRRVETVSVTGVGSERENTTKTSIEYDLKGNKIKETVEKRGAIEKTGEVISSQTEYRYNALGVVVYKKTVSGYGEMQKDKIRTEETLYDDLGRMVFHSKVTSENGRELYEREWYQYGEDNDLKTYRKVSNCDNYSYGTGDESRTETQYSYQYHEEGFDEVEITTVTNQKGELLKDSKVERKGGTVVFDHQGLEKLRDLLEKGIELG